MRMHESVPRSSLELGPLALSASAAWRVSHGPRPVRPALEGSGEAHASSLAPRRHHRFPRVRAT